MIGTYPQLPLGGTGVGTHRKPGWVIDIAGLELRLAGRSRASVLASADLDANNVASRIGRGTAFELDEVRRLALELGCSHEDFSKYQDSVPATRGGRGRGQRSQVSADLEIL